MKIRTKLQLSTIASMGIVTLILIVILFTSRQTYNDLRRISLYTELINKVFALDILFNDYLLHPQEREIIQWESVHGSLGELLERFEARQYGEQFFVSFLKESHQDLNLLFFQLEPAGMPSANPDVSQKRRDLIADQLLIKLDYMVAEASKMVDESQERIISAQHKTDILVLVLLVVMVATSAIILLFTGNRIAKSIEDLQDGIKIFAGGNFDHRIDVKNDDETSLLSQAFNKMADDLRSSYSALRGEIVQRQRTEEALRLDEARLETLFEMSRITEASEKQIADFALEQELMLTKSKIGILGLMNEDETAMTLHTWSKDVMDECAVPNKPMHFPVEKGGLWAEVIRQRKPFIVNDYLQPNPFKRGYPEGHIDLRRLMVVPVFEGNRIVAVAAAGNKEKEYDAADLRQFTLLMDGMWKLIRRERAEVALREAESLSAMGRALSSVAHDMKTPLIAIGGFTLLVQKHMDEDNPYRDKLEIVIKETRRLENMVKDMLDFSRPLELHRSMEDIKQVIDESLDVVECSARERKVGVRNLTSKDLPPCSFDAARVKQMLINLLMNAVQASPEGEIVDVNSALADGNLIIDVIDHGPGIPHEHRQTVFYPFFTTKEEGTGLGLPIVKKIVDAHQGKLKILDNPEKGTTFKVIIPVP